VADAVRGLGMHGRAADRRAGTHCRQTHRQRTPPRPLHSATDHHQELRRRSRDTNHRKRKSAVGTRLRPSPG